MSNISSDRIEALAVRLERKAWRNRKSCRDYTDGLADAQLDAAKHLRALASGERSDG